MNFTKTEKLHILNTLIKIAGADGEHRDEEYDLIHRVTEQLQVEPLEMEKLFVHELETSIPKSESQRITSFFYMLLMISADGEISQDELVLTRDLAFKLGLPDQAVNSALKKLEIYPSGNIPAKEIIDIFKVHHN